MPRGNPGAYVTGKSGKNQMRGGKKGKGMKKGGKKGMKKVPGTYGF